MTTTGETPLVQTHGAIKDGPNATYLCSDCGQNINAPGCRGPLPAAKASPTFAALLNDPTQQLDPGGSVLHAALGATPAADVAGDEHQGDDRPDQMTRRLHDAWNQGYQARDGQKPYTSNPWSN